MSNAIFTSRVSKASEFLKVSSQDIIHVLYNLGIEDSDDGLALLEASITSKEILLDAFYKADFLKNDSKIEKLPLLKIHAVIEILKGNNPFSKKVENDTTSAIIEAIKAQKPIEQLNDKELLELYEEDRDNDKVSQELMHRTSNQPFIVLSSSGKINISVSTDLLKRVRKGIIQQVIQVDDEAYPVYKINELDPKSMFSEICPICESKSLYDGYCDTCNLNFKEITEDSKKFMILVSRSSVLDKKSYADKKNLHILAKEGLEALMKEWPLITKEFKRLQAIDELPKLRIARSTPSSYKDPFYRSNTVSGNKSF